MPLAPFRSRAPFGAVSFRRIRAALCLGPAVALAACGGGGRADPLPAAPQTVIISNACPGAGFLAEAANRVDFPDGAGPDTPPAVSARMVEIEIDCEIEDRIVDAELEFRIEAQRGPGGPGDVRLPYFVAVTKDDRILARESFTAEIDFGRDGTARVRQRIGDIDIPLAGETTGAAFTLFVGFELSPAHVVYNRQRLPY